MGVRGKRLAAVAARLERVADTQDLSPVLEPGTLEEARQLLQVAGDGADGLQARNMLGWLYWYRYRARSEREDGQDLDAAIRMFTPCFIHSGDDLPPPLLPALADQAAPAASNLLSKALGSTDLALISATADLWQRMVSAIPADDEDRPGYLSNLGAAQLARFGLTGALADVDAAIGAWQAALAATPDGHPDRPRYLSSLGNALQARFGRTGALADVDAAIEAARAAVAGTAAGDPDLPGRLSSLGNALQARFGRTGALADVEAAVEAARAAVAGTPAGDPHLPGQLSSLGNALRARFGETGAPGDVDAAVEALQAAVAATPDGHPDRSDVPVQPGGRAAGPVRADRGTGRPGCGDRGRPGRGRRHPCRTPRPCRAHCPTWGPRCRPGSGGPARSADLDAAIETLQAAVAATPAGHPDRADVPVQPGGRAAGPVSSVPGRWRTWMRRSRPCQAAVAATPADHPNRARYLSNLGAALEARFGRTGRTADLDAAIQACPGCSDRHPCRPSQTGRVTCPAWGTRCRRGSSEPGSKPTGKPRCPSTRRRRSSDRPRHRSVSGRPAPRRRWCAESEPGQAADLLEMRGAAAA